MFKYPGGVVLNCKVHKNGRTNSKITIEVAGTRPHIGRCFRTTGTADALRPVVTPSAPHTERRVTRVAGRRVARWCGAVESGRGDGGG